MLLFEGKDFINSKRSDIWFVMQVIKPEIRNYPQKNSFKNNLSLKEFHIFRDRKTKRKGVSERLRQKSKILSDPHSTRQQH